MEKFFDFVEKSTTPYQCVENCVDILRSRGFNQLDFSGDIDIKKGESYYFQYNGSYLFAFVVGKSYKIGQGFRMAAAHGDSPCFRIKSNMDKKCEGYVFLNTEGYGGANFTNWLDRPLSIAGRISVESGNVFKPQIFNLDFQMPMAIIPSLAVHFSKTDNEYQIHNSKRLPLYSLDDEKELSGSALEYAISEKMHIKPEQILDYELYVYHAASCEKIGLHQELIASPRLDNQTGVYGLIQAITNAERDNGINAIVIFDGEEVGNISKGGAFSNVTEMIWKRIYLSLGYGEEAYYKEAMRGHLVSVDAAHAFHPLFAEHYDRNNICKLNQGICIKQASSQAYATDSSMSGMIQQICKNKKIPFQKYANHADVRGGGTLGSIVSCILASKTADIGVPVLSMHSSMEIMGNKDEEALIQFLQAYFSMD